MSTSSGRLIHPHPSLLPNVSFSSSPTPSSPNHSTRSLPPPLPTPECDHPLRYLCNAMSIHHSNTGRNWPKFMERLCATEASLSKWVPDQVRSNSFACVRVPDRIFVPVRIACWWLCSDQSHFCCIAFNYPSMVGPGSGRFYQILLCATVIFIPTIVINKWSSTETKECCYTTLFAETVLKPPFFTPKSTKSNDDLDASLYF